MVENASGGPGTTARLLRWGAVTACMAWVCLGWGAGDSGRSGPEPQAGLSAASAAGEINFSFDQVDIRTFVKLVGDITGRRFVVDDAVQGKVTVVMPRIPAPEVYPLFVRILESAGCAAVESEGVVRIVPFPPRVVANAPVLSTNQAAGGLGLLTRVMRLQYLPVAEVRKMLETMSGGKLIGNIGSIESSNYLIITDTPDNLRRTEKLIAEIDRPGAGTTVFEVVPLKCIDAKEIATQFAPLMASSTAERQRAGGMVQGQGTDRGLRNVLMIPAVQANSLIMVGNPGDVTELKKLISQIDVESPTGGGSLHAIFLKYLSADDAAKSLNALLAKQATAADRARGQAGAPSSSLADRRVAIEPSAANNALLVDAGPRDFELIQKLVDELDKTPQQVVIEVVIAEVSLSDARDIGVDMASIQMPAKVGDTVIQGANTLGDNADTIMNAIQNGILPGGLTVGVAHGTRIDSDGNVVASYPALFNIRAQEKKGRYRILSSVPLLAQNNREASVNVVNNIPILRSTIQGGSGTSRDVIQNIDRLDVGIKLKLTPHINPDNQVTLVLNPSIEAIIDSSSTSSQYTPTIAKREVSTTVTVPDGQTIVLSGLIREDQTKVVRRVPILGSIPLLGWLFRHTEDGRERTNLLIFVTPKVVTNRAMADAISADWQARTGLNSTNNAPEKDAP